MTGSERILAAFRRTKGAAPPGANLRESGHAIIYYVNKIAIASFHANKRVAEFSWLQPLGVEGYEQVGIFVLPRKGDGPDVLDSLWESLYRMDISTLTEIPPEPYAG